MRRNKWVILLSLLLGVLVSAFHSKNGAVLDYPDSWPRPVYDFRNNPISEDGIALGRSLFYDPILSADSSISCASCHLSYTAFTHVDHALSHGIHDSIGDRNSLALMNLAWSNNFMWDGAVNHLDMQALAPITHAAEMGGDIKAVVEKLNASEVYSDRFKAIYGMDEIDGAIVLKSLAQFQVTLISADSKYDKVMAREEGVHFTAQEERGLALFNSSCNSCHQAPLFTTGDFANNGLPVDMYLNDTGRMRVTRESADSLKFKIPTLRNIEFSKPYMHDGRFKTLSQVLDHYRSGILDSPTLEAELAGGIALSSDEKVDLIAFLLTLTDRAFLFNPNHAFPRNN